MTDLQINTYIAETVFGLVPCDQWRMVSLGAAGGMVLAKNCDHEQCYSQIEMKNVHGQIGGVPDYLHTWRHTADVLELMKETITIQYLAEDREEGPGWEVSWLPKEERMTIVHEDLQRAICLAVVPEKA